MAVMATDKPKRPVGRPKSDSPQGRSPATIIHTRIDPKIGAALEAFRDAQKFKPILKDVLELAIQKFLEEEGFWPPETK